MFSTIQLVPFVFLTMGLSNCKRFSKPYINEQSSSIILGEEIDGFKFSKFTIMLENLGLVEIFDCFQNCRYQKKDNNL